MSKKQKTKKSNLELYKFINFQGTHVKIAKKQKSMFQLYELLNFEDSHGEITKEYV